MKEAEVQRDERCRSSPLASTSARNCRTRWTYVSGNSERLAIADREAGHPVPRCQRVTAPQPAHSPPVPMPPMGDAQGSP